MRVDLSTTSDNKRTFLINSRKQKRQLFQRGGELWKRLPKIKNAVDLMFTHKTEQKIHVVKFYKTKVNELHKMSFILWKLLALYGHVSQKMKENSAAKVQEYIDSIG